MKLPWKILKLQSKHDFVLETATYKVQRGITKKIHKQELWFLHSACRHMVLNICMKFHEDILEGFNIIQRTQFCHRNCYLQSSKGQNSKHTYPRVSFCVLHVVQCWLIFLWSFMKISWTVFKVIQQARFCHRNCYVRSSKRHNSKNYIYPRVMVLALFLRSARGPMLLNIYMKFHEDILNCFQVTERTQFCDRQTDRCPNRQTTRAKTIRLPTLKERDIIMICVLQSLSMKACWLYINRQIMFNPTRENLLTFT